MKMPEKEGPSNSTEGLILDSAEDSWQTVTKKKNNKKNKGETCQSNDDKENVIMTQSEVGFDEFFVQISIVIYLVRVWKLDVFHKIQNWIL